MEMKSLIFIVVLLLFFIEGCGYKRITQSDIKGTWESSDGASLNFTNSGVEARNIPQYLILGPPQTKELYAGNGTWEIQYNIPNGQQYDSVKVDFSHVSNYSRFGTDIYIDKKGNHWVLFFWQEEEGGKRYEFVRKD